MRNPKRIHGITNLINALWLTYPDMRYFQLMDSIKAEHNRLNLRLPHEDLFNVEDDKLEETLFSILNNGFTKA